jgi:hypothetical protein
MMMTPAPQQANMPNNTKSENEYVSAIQSLTLRAKDLAGSIGRWNKANTFFVGFTVLAAFGLFVTQRTANNKGTQLVRMQDELSEAKENLASLRIATVEGGNIQLRTDLQTATGEARSKQLELEREQQKTALAQREAAEAQLAVKSYVDVLAKSMNPRMLDSRRFIEILKGKPKGTAEIWYEPNDVEARDFASQLHDLLGANGAGWNVVGIRPLSGEPLYTIVEGQTSPLDELRVEAADTGMAVTSNRLFPYDVEGQTAWGALNMAIERGTGGWNVSGLGGHWMRAYPSLPDDHFIIVVGHHRINVPLWVPPWQTKLPKP